MGRKAFLIASVLLLSLLPVGAEAVGADCVRADLASFDEVQGRGTLPGYPEWEQAVGLTKSRLPMVPTLLAVRGDVACDLTNGLAAFLGPAAVPADAAGARDLALLAVSAIYVDVLPEARAAGEASIVRLDDGWHVHLPVWTPRNGVVADASVLMDGDLDASFVVKERAVGDFTAAIEGWNLRPGATQDLLAGDVSPLATKTLMGANGDGTQWRVRYFTTNYASEAEADHHAQMHLDGAMAAYANETAWGFRSFDPDRILDLTLDGCDCIYREANANIHMFPRANDILPLVPGLDYRAEEETAELIVGHELFHHMQYGIMQWRHGNWLVEGMARFSETINVPDFTYIPTSLTYYPNANGMNGWLLSPQLALASHTYDLSILWGWLYAHEGGVDLMKAVLEESAVGGTNGNVDGVAAIQRAMDRVPGGEHATFEEAYAAFVEDVLTREGFVWGAPDGSQVHDWATYFVPIARSPFSTGAFIAAPWSINVHDMRPTNPAGAAVGSHSANPALTVLLYTETDGARSAAPALAVNAVAGVDDAALVMVRASPPLPQDTYGTAGLYGVAVAR